MKKRVMIIVGGVIVIIAGLLVAVLLNLGPVIKIVVNTYGPDITKTDIHLSDVDVSLLSARAEIRGFSLGNPGIFKSPKALAVESIYIDVDEKSLTSDLIIIEKIEVIAPHITYEKRGRTDNFQIILNNIKGKAEADKGPGEKIGEKGEGETGEGKQAQGKRIVIRDVIIRDGRITLAMSMLGGKEITVPVPDIHLTNIGQKKGGVSPAEAAREIFAILYEKSRAPDIMNAFDSRLKIRESDIKAAGGEVTRRAKALEKKLKGLLGE